MESGLALRDSQVYAAGRSGNQFCEDVKIAHSIEFLLEERLYHSMGGSPGELSEELVT